MKTDILVLDSGVEKTHIALKNGNIHYLFDEQNDTDYNGHGTAVVGILCKQAPHAEITVGRVLDQHGMCTTELLVRMLEYIYENVECKILHLSLGVREDSGGLRTICRKIWEKGIIIVSAFDNAGAVSYPAAYNFVIGVEASARCRKYDDFVVIKNSMINIKAKGGVQRLAWKDNSYVISQGASFAAAYVSAYIFNRWNQTEGFYYEILRDFTSVARYTYNLKKNDITKKKQDLSFIHYASVFPYNKEIHAVFHFKSMLPFELKHIYDIKYSGNIGKEVESFDESGTLRIENIEEITNEKNDTLIIGHVEELEAALNYPIKKKILQLCLKKGLNVFMFDKREFDEFKELFQSAGLCLACASSTYQTESLNKFGKLFSSLAPVLGVFGTTSKQGKYTLQMEMRRRLLRDGYSVEQIGTEPSAQLFNMEAYPFGYDADSEEVFTGMDKVEKLNALIHEMDLREPDIILVGSQSGTVPMLYDNIGQIPLAQLVFLLGTLPDGIILCVNFNEDISYIRRTVNTIQGLAESRIIAFAIYPKYYKNGWQFANAHQSHATETQLQKFGKILETEFGVAAFPLSTKENYEQVYQHCIQQFQGE